MDLLKIKLENCYGIPFLDKEFDFSGGQNRPKAYAIYAQNGLMKTSFARAFDDLAKGKEPKEERYNRTATYVVEADGTAVPKEMMYVLKAEIDIREDSPAISDILVNPENKARYDELLVDLDEKKKKVINALQRTSKVPKNDVEEKILQDWGEGDLPACIEKIKGISLTDDLTGFVYATIFDSKALQVLKSQEFIAKANEFNDRYQELFSQAGTIYQKGVFNPTKAEASFSTLNKQPLPQNLWVEGGKKLEHCLPRMDRMVFAETIKSKPKEDNADKDSTEQGRTVQVVCLRRRLYPVC